MPASAGGNVHSKPSYHAVGAAATAAPTEVAVVDCDANGSTLVDTELTLPPNRSTPAGHLPSFTHVAWPSLSLML
jgi:hypothetical protein